MTAFTIHDAETAPLASRATLASIQANWKFIPNLHGILAEAPIALEAYNAVFTLFGQSSFSAAEQQVAFLAISYENGCTYCMAGHSVLAAGAQVPPKAIRALRDGSAIADPRLEVLRAFAQRLVRARGRVDAIEVDAFIAAGFSKAQVLELLVALAAKTISNYANHLAATPLDAFMGQTVWTPPAERIAEAA